MERRTFLAMVGGSLLAAPRVAEAQPPPRTGFLSAITATRFAKEATLTIPIVMAQNPDLVGTGFVASLARQGGNITGLSNFRPELGGKRLELLKETVPKLARVAVLGTSTIPGTPQSL